MKTVDLSGAGGEIELMSQTMLMAGIKFLKEHPQLVQKQIITEEVQLLAGQLEETVVGAMGEEFAKNPLAHPMFDMVMKHLAFIRNKGLKVWFEEATKDEPERVFEFDGTLASIPTVQRPEATLEHETVPEFEELTPEQIQAEINENMEKTVAATNAQFEKAGKAFRISLKTSDVDLDKEEADSFKRFEQEVEAQERIRKLGDKKEEPK